jgi:hypothetical protein
MILRFERNIEALEEIDEPLAFESVSRDIGSSFGGASWMGVLGSNLPAIVKYRSRRSRDLFF